ncbi:MAG: PAS domain S-box protein, partial [Gemmataceae bacterium]|nr:PAS domain S-box protein [Gemmataceae bacterium]
SLPLMVVLTDRDLRVTYMNPATSSISGYGLDEVADPSAWMANIHADDLERLLATHRAAREEGKAGRCELRYEARDGSEKAGLAFIQPRRQEGEIVGTLTLLLDLTRERQLERDLERGRRLELIGRLASGVAHDFNNMLGVVLGVADLARLHLPADHPVMADLARITAAGEQATGLAAQMLAFSRSKPMPVRLVRLDDEARPTLELVRAALPATIRLEASLGEAATRADGTQVRQVLMNLCLNARDAMPGGGVLRVGTARRGEWAVLEVADSGQGMTDELRRRIFEPFYSTKEGGTGLGLAVVQQIVEGCGGSIEVESEPGRGIRFTIRWPAAED